MKIKIFLEQGAQLPKLAHDSDYGYDVVATKIIPNDGMPYWCKYGTGIHVDFPSCHNGKKVCMQVYARSSICKKGLMLSNGVGIIDSGYHGEITAAFYRLHGGEWYNEGDKIAQIAMSNGEPIEWEVVNSIEELGDSERGCGGYGSTGK